MAEGRMIITKISRDPRIAGLSIRARGIFAYLIPHTDNNGSLPRDKHELRLTCFPGWDYTDDDIELSVLEFLTTKPPIATEQIIRGEARLVLTDFELCNWNLDFLRKRRERNDLAKVSGHSELSGMSKMSSRIEGNRIEKKRIEKNIKTTTKDIVPAAQKPKPPSSVQKIVEAYKMAKNVSRKDAGWDKNNFARYAKAAKGLLECFNNDIQRAAAYVFSQGEEFDSEGITWTLETIARHAWDNKGKIDEYQLSEMDAASVLEQAGPNAPAPERAMVRRTSRPVRAGEIQIGEYGKLDGTRNDTKP